MSHPPRPTLTQEMILEAARSVAEAIGTPEAEDIARYFSPGMDGYRLARELEENALRDITMEDVEALDAMDEQTRSILARAERQWEAEHNIRPPLPTGARIRWADHTGTITGIYLYGAARYLVKSHSEAAVVAAHFRGRGRDVQVTALVPYLPEQPETMRAMLDEMERMLNAGGGFVTPDEARKLIAIIRGKAAEQSDTIPVRRKLLQRLIKAEHDMGLEGSVTATLAATEVFEKALEELRGLLGGEKA